MFPNDNPVDLSLSHSEQSAFDDFSSSFKYVSFGHSSHCLLPLPSWYLPGGQSVQTPGLLPYLPRSLGRNKRKKKKKKKKQIKWKEKKNRLKIVFQYFNIVQ